MAATVRVNLEVDARTGEATVITAANIQRMAKASLGPMVYGEWPSHSAVALYFSGPRRHNGTTPKDRYLRRYVRRGWHRVHSWPSLPGRRPIYLSDALLEDTSVDLSSYIANAFEGQE